MYAYLAWLLGWFLSSFCIKLLYTVHMAILYVHIHSTYNRTVTDLAAKWPPAVAGLAVVGEGNGVCAAAAGADGRCPWWVGER